jgi:hypothetical protein
MGGEDGLAPEIERAIAAAGDEVVALVLAIGEGRAGVDLGGRGVRLYWEREGER